MPCSRPPPPPIGRTFAQPPTGGSAAQWPGELDEKIVPQTNTLPCRTQRRALCAPLLEMIMVPNP